MGRMKDREYSLRQLRARVMILEGGVASDPRSQSNEEANWAGGVATSQVGKNGETGCWCSQEVLLLK
jgi:hypothetical protein